MVIAIHDRFYRNFILTNSRIRYILKMLFGSQLNRGRKHLKSAGVVVQLGERLHGMQEVVGSSPISSKAKKWLKFLCWKGFQPFIFMCEGESSGYTFMWHPV